MHPIKRIAALCGILILPTFISAQSTAGPRLDIERQEVFQSLKDSQWVRVASTDLGRRDGRLLDVTPSEIVLSPGSEPIRVPATSIDTVWTRGHSALQGGIAGGLLLGALGAIMGLTAGDPGGDDYNPGFWGLVLGGGGIVGGGVVGALVGLGIPRWRRQLP